MPKAMDSGKLWFYGTLDFSDIVIPATFPSNRYCIPGAKLSVFIAVRPLLFLKS